jgi:trehalose utilization protein
MSGVIRVTVWGENVHEHRNPAVRSIYPDGMHAAIAARLTAELGHGVAVRTATLQEGEHGLGEAALAATDVLTWWGHLAHDKVDDAVVARVFERVQEGMGLIVLHSAHLSKIFRRLMGTRCNLRWRETDDRELVWTVAPAHPIAEGVPQPLVIPRHEMYGEFFDIPPPDELVFISAFSGGEVFRSGCCFQRGKGRVFYFSPGHETYPVYHQPEIGRVLANAVRWAYQPRPSVIETRSSPNAPAGWFETSPD